MTHPTTEIATTDVDSTTEYMQCPFCKEADFDAEGLKTHLTHDCEIYRSIQVRPRIFL